MILVLLKFKSSISIQSQKYQGKGHLLYMTDIPVLARTRMVLKIVSASLVLCFFAPIRDPIYSAKKPNGIVITAGYGKINKRFANKDRSYSTGGIKLFPVDRIDDHR